MRAAVQVAMAVAVGVTAIHVAGDTSGVETMAASLPLRAPIKSIAPAQGQVVGIGHPVIVTFNEAIANRAAAERAIGVESTPAMTGTYEWIDERTVQWVPDQYWPAHSDVQLVVNNTRTDFETGAALVGVADISDHTFTVTIDGSPAGLPAPHHLPHAGVEGTLLASMGRTEYPTPVGEYTVLEKKKSVIMDSSSVGIPITETAGYLQEVDDAVRITRRGIFVHSAPWAVPSIGFDNTSHGCISLIPAAAAWYFDNVNIGDPVIVQE